MLQALFRRAKATVESSIGEAVDRALVAVPFIIAAGFGVTALVLRLIREYGAETANLTMAVLFLVIGLVGLVVLWMRRQPQSEEEEEAEANSNSAQADSPAQNAFSAAEQELMMAALTRVAPLAVPHIMRLLLRNLPLLAAIATAAYVLSRPTDGPKSSTARMEPAE